MQQQQRQDQSLEDQAADLALRIRAMYNALTKSKDPKDIRAAVQIVRQNTLLLPNMCQLAKLLTPDIQQKLDEYIRAANEPGHQVLAARNGADLKDEKDQSYEYKVSQLKSTGPRKCNFNWNLPNARNKQTNDDPDKRREKLVTNVLNKLDQGRGYAVLEVQDDVRQTLVKFKLGGGFLVEYFRRLQLGVSTVHNMGCLECKTCKRFHRLDKLQDASDAYDKDPQSVVWENVFADTPSACNPGGNDTRQRRRRRKPKKHSEKN